MAPVPVHRGRVLLLRVAIAGGVAALAYYLAWWLSRDRWVDPRFMLLLVAAALYGFAQLLATWWLYARAIRRPEPPPPDDDLTVDVFVTACGEPYAIVDRALRACVALRGPHRTWLLDDGRDPVLAELAHRLGAGYLTREGRADRKAGNVNAALPRTRGDLIALFDVDHAPEPEFLERTLGWFRDPRVGFVQAMLTARNEDEGFVARAASESTYDYYNVASLGQDGLGGATHVGSNGVLRRRALESIGGYRPGLAEDLSTSLALHSAGWRSVYVAEPLAPGLSPVDVPGWFDQQLKWARGVFEVLLTEFPRALRLLTPGQRLCYLVRCTYYWLGVVVAVHLLFMIAMLLFGEGVARIDFAVYFQHAIPLGLAMITTRHAALLAWRHPAVPRRPQWRAMCLVYGTWPVYAVAWLLATLRVPLGFRPTPKGRGGRLGWKWLAVQGAALGALGVALTRAFTGAAPTPPLLLLLAAMQVVPLTVVFALSLATWIGPAATSAAQRAARTAPASTS